MTIVHARLAALHIIAPPLHGPAALLGPTGGYLMAFPVGAAIAGFLAERGWTGTKIFASFIAQFASNIFIVLFGGLWLFGMFGVDKAFTVGLIPFVFPALLKAVLATGILAGIKYTTSK